LYELHYFKKDHLGSARQLLDATGTVKARYDYEPYGGEFRTMVSTQNDNRFTGQKLDSENGFEMEASTPIVHGCDL